MRERRTRAEVARFYEGVRAFAEISKNPGCHPNGEHRFNADYCPGCGRAVIYCVTDPKEEGNRLFYDIKAAKLFVDVDAHPDEHTDSTVYGSHFFIRSYGNWLTADRPWIAMYDQERDYPDVWTETLKWILSKMPEDEEEFKTAMYSSNGWATWMMIGMIAAAKEKPWCACFLPYNVAVCFDCQEWFVGCAMCYEPYRRYNPKFHFHDFVGEHVYKKGHFVLDDEFRTFFIHTMMVEDPVLFRIRPIQELQRVIFWLMGDDNPYEFWPRLWREELGHVRVPSPHFKDKTDNPTG